MKLTDARAREIFGQNFFGREEWTQFYDERRDSDEYRSLSALPWTESEVTAACPFVKGKRIHETHFAFLGLERLHGRPLTIEELRCLHPQSNQPHFFGKKEMRMEPVQMFETEKTCKLEWHLMPLSFVPGTAGLPLKEQVRFLPEEYDVPFAIEEVLKDILYFRRNRVYLNPKTHARTRDRFPHGVAHVGCFDGSGLQLGSWRSTLGHPWVGLGAIRRDWK